MPGPAARNATTVAAVTAGDARSPVDQELVATPAHRQIGVADMGPEDCRNPRQHAVADGMGMLVVDRLEVAMWSGAISTENTVAVGSRVTSRWESMARSSGESGSSTAGPLAGGAHVGDILQPTAAADERPPIGRTVRHAGDRDTRPREIVYH